jgi:hypothetical protein
MGHPALPVYIVSVLRAHGKNQGKKGENSRANALTPEQRSEAARKAVLARCAKKKGEN